MTNIGNIYKTKKNAIDKDIILIIAEYQNLRWETLPKSELLKRLGIINNRQEEIERKIIDFRNTVLLR